MPESVLFQFMEILMKKRDEIRSRNVLMGYYVSMLNDLKYLELEEKRRREEIMELFE